MNEDTISKEDLFKERIEQAKKIEELILEIERLNNIIKEVRKYIGSKEHYEDDFDTEIEKINKILNRKHCQQR